jgi:glyoxylase-like metal-dependent hydrolase (beta-lactamase superfamily II)
LAHIEIAPGIFVVIGYSFPRCNTLVIVDEEVTVVDPGCNVEDLRALLQENDLTLRDVDTVILSHIHPDHITHAMRLNRLSKCRIAANEITAPLFNDKEKMKEFLGFHKGHPVRAMWENLVNSKMYGCLDEGSVDEVLRDGDKFALGNTTLRMLYTPGHLPDHMCIEILEPNMIYSSDIDLTEFGPYYGHPNSSIPEFKDSIRKVRENNYSALVSGHLKSPVVKDYKTALYAYERQFEIREDMVLSLIMGWASSIPQITMTPIIYPSLSDPVFLQFETWMIEHHVTSLIERNLIEERKGKLVPL